MADAIYNKFGEYMGDNTIDMDNDTFKICLLTSDYTIDKTKTDYLDLTNEVVGDDYTATGVALATVTWVEASGLIKFDAGDAEWGPAANISAQYAVVYSDTSTDDKLVCVFDFGETKSVAGGTFTVQFGASGILTITET